MKSGGCAALTASAVNPASKKMIRPS